MRRLRNDDGASAIVVAIVFPVVLLGMAALTLDIGSMYVQKRQLQNGADAAALAVARDCAASPDTCDATIAAALGAADLATPNSDAGAGNFGEASTVLLCGTIPGLAPCLGADALEEDWVDGAPYVKARTSGSNAPILGQFLGYGGGTIAAEAVVALDEPRRLVGGTAPFALCAQNTDEVEGWPGVSPLAGTYPDYTVNEDAIGLLYPIMSNKNDVVNQCGLGVDWRGWIEEDVEWTLPGDVDSNSGGKVGHLMFLADESPVCDIHPAKGMISGSGECSFAIPLCTNDDTNDPWIWCPTWGAFQFTFPEAENGEKSLYGEFLGARSVIGGQFSDEPPKEGESYVLAPRLAG